MTSRIRLLLDLLLFGLCSISLCIAVTGSAAIGRSLLAPVDIAPALWERFEHVSPDGIALPRNHHIVDQLSYDLPMQWTVYHAYRRGEIPWWDPYTAAGRPLIADAHVNATDPVRVACYLVFSDFVLAYNWTLILHYALLGSGMYFLLRTLGFAQWIAVGLGLSFELAGTFIIYFGHPWVTASFAWYPWLWAAWHSQWKQPTATNRVGSVLAVVGILLAGNLQSHAYLPIFALCFAIGYAGRSFVGLKRAALIVGVTGVIAVFIAAPIIGPEIEVFALRFARRMGNTGGEPWHGLMSLAFVWPWMLGTFKTIGLPESSFQLFAGTCLPVFAFLGFKRSANDGELTILLRRVSIALIASVIVTTFTPLIHFFYQRISGLAMMGLFVLAAVGLSRLLNDNQSRVWPTARAAAIAIGVIMIGTAAVAYFVFPAVREKLIDTMVAHAAGDQYLGRSLPLRMAQVAAFPSEVGFENPAIWVGLATLALAIFSLGNRKLLSGAIALNIVGPFLFAHSFIPNVPVEQWQRFLIGSIAQQRIAKTVGENRFRETKPFERQFSRYFPMQVCHLFKIHNLDGYYALGPEFYALTPDFDPQVASDFFVTDNGELDITNPSRNARFHWLDSRPTPLSITSYGLNEVRIDFANPSGGNLRVTDTFYPGWTARDNNGRACAITQAGVFSTILVPPDSSSITLHYRPRGMEVMIMISIFGLLAVTAYGVRTGRSKQQSPRV